MRCFNLLIFSPQSFHLVWWILVSVLFRIHQLYIQDYFLIVWQICHVRKEILHVLHYHQKHQIWTHHLVNLFHLGRHPLTCVAIPACWRSWTKFDCLSPYGYLLFCQEVICLHIHHKDLSRPKIDSSSCTACIFLQLEFLLNSLSTFYLQFKLLI